MSYNVITSKQDSELIAEAGTLFEGQQWDNHLGEGELKMSNLWPMLLSKYKGRPDAWNKHVVPNLQSEATSPATSFFADTAHPFRLIPWLLELDSSRVQNEAGQRLSEFSQENTLVMANTLFQQHKSWLYTWTSPDGQYWNQIHYICSKKWRSSIQSTKTRPGADCGSHHQLLIAKFRLKLKKVGKTIRPFRYDLSQIPYTVEVINRFKGLDLADRVSEEQ